MSRKISSDRGFYQPFDLGWEKSEQKKYMDFWLEKEGWDTIYKIGEPAIHPLINFLKLGSTNNEKYACALKTLIKIQENINIKKHLERERAMDAIIKQIFDEIKKNKKILEKNKDKNKDKIKKLDLIKKEVEEKYRISSFDENTKRENLLGLFKFNPEKFVNGLKPIISFYRYSKVKIAAIKIAGDIKDVRLIPVLIEELKEYKSESFSYAEIGEESKKSLIKIGKLDIQSILDSMLTKFNKDIFSKEIDGLSDVLGGIGWIPKNDIYAVIYYINRRKWDKVTEIGEPAVEPLLKVLYYKDFVLYEDSVHSHDSWMCEEGGILRRKAAYTLGEIGDERAIKALNEIITSTDKTFINDKEFLKIAAEAKIKIENKNT